MKNDGGTPRSPAPPRGWLEETGFLGCEQALPEIYRSTRFFGAFFTCPESAFLPGSSKCWRGLPTADTRIFRAHHHLSSHQPPRRRRVLAANGPSLLPSPPLCKRHVLQNATCPSIMALLLHPHVSVPWRLRPPEDPSRGLCQPLVLRHLVLLCVPPSPEPVMLTLLAGTVPPQSPFNPTYCRARPDLLVLEWRAPGGLARLCLSNP